MLTLVVISCGKRKIWGKCPNAGPTCAKDVYLSPAFKANMEYGEKFAPDSWVILSAKYGFISPEFVIPETYDVTFDDPTTKPMSEDELRQQVREKNLDRFNRIVVLGNTTYGYMVRSAFAGSAATVLAPLEKIAAFPPGIRIGAVRSAINSSTPFDR
jgi:hypothetical protein